MIIIQFNEAIKDLIKKYSKKYNLVNLNSIIEKSTITHSEKVYENLEPWIQWTSFYSSKNFDNHRVHKLGDYKFDKDNIFVKLADQNKKVGIFCSMNQFYYKKFEYYIPDPWSNERSDGKFFSDSLKKISSYLINRNSSLSLPKTTLFNLIYLLSMLPLSSIIYIALNGFISLLKKDRARLAGLFDYFLFKLSIKIHKTKNLDVSSIFLNGLAHVQHHYLHSSEFINSKNPNWYINSSKDPIRDILIYYEKIFYDLNKSRTDYLIVTGLGQEILHKPEYYWRFKDHTKIFKKLLPEINHNCIPKMSRDFYLYFNDYNGAKNAEKILKSYTYLNNNIHVPIFEYLDTKENSLFGSFVYSLDNDKGKIYKENVQLVDLKNEIDFVAVKNSIHSEQGWFYSNSDKINTKEVEIWNFSKLLFEKLIA